MIRLDGKVVAAKIRAELSAGVRAFRSRAGRAPGLAVLLVGDDPASQVYVKSKLLACQETGFFSLEERLPKNIPAEEVIEVIRRLNLDAKIDGILVQLPLPSHINTEQILAAIDPRKDCDGLTLENMGLLYAGRPRSVPCTPHGVMKILEHYGFSVSGRHAVVVGRSAIVGRPMAQLLLNADATVTVCHSKTKDLEALTRQGDIVVVAAGRPEFLGSSAFQSSAVVIDVGIHRLDQGVGQKPRLVGDVLHAEVEGKVKALTPVPGGVGPMTIAMLLANTLNLAEGRAADEHR